MKGLKFRAAVGLLVGSLLLFPLLTATTALAAPPTKVHISGRVSDDGGAFGEILTVTVAANAKGSALSLAGRGVDSSTQGGVLLKLAGIPGQCTYTLTGWTDGTMITLSGSVVQSTGPFVGASISLVANADTGDITFVFAGITFTGTGNVFVRNA